MKAFFEQLPLSAIFAIFLLAALIVWIAGRRLPAAAAEIADRTGIGQAFVGLLILGGITSLPELATSVSAAAIGAPSLAINNILGSVSFNLVLLALADAALGKDSLTAVVAKSSTLMQGALGMLVLAVAAAAIAAGDTAILGVGAWSMLILASCLGAMWLSYRYERRSPWIALETLPSSERPVHQAPRDRTLTPLIWTIVFLAGLIMAGGTVLSLAGDAIAERTGLGGGLVGFLLLALATSLPELSAVIGAVRLRRHELAIGEIFGSNLFDLAIIFVIDVVAAGPPVLAASGRFEILTATLGLVLTGLFVVGLLERRNRKLFLMGLDSLAVLLTYVAGVVLIWRMQAA